MSLRASMQINLRLPNRLLYEGEAARLYAEAENGAFGMLPNHADFVTSLVPSVLILTLADGEEKFFGIDQGLLVKRGSLVEIAVRRGLQGDDLVHLAAEVQRAFVAADEEERVARSALAKLELGMVKQLSELRKPLP